MKAAGTHAEFRAAVKSLLDGAGPAPACANTSSAPGPCRAPAHDSLRKNLDLRWLNDTTLLGAAMTRELARVRDNPQSGAGRYVKFQATAMFDADTAFNAPQTQYPEEGQRLLALFRFWNAARYYFPYMYVNDGDWNAVLPEFIPRMIAARDAAEYHLAVQRAHGARQRRARLRRLAHAERDFRHARFRHSKRGSSRASSWCGSPRPTRRCIGLPQPGGLQRGDVITHINGVPVANRRQELSEVRCGRQRRRTRSQARVAGAARKDGQRHIHDRTKRRDARAHRADGAAS